MSAPRLLLGVTSLDQPVRTTRDRVLEVAARFREPESLAVAMVKALDAGAEAIHAAPSPLLRAALAELRRPVPLLARLPHVPPHEDLFHEPWLARPLAGPAVGHTRAALAALSMPLALVRGELAPRIAARIERDRTMLGARAWSGLALPATLTDLALAADHGALLERLVRFGRARFGSCGLETHNLARLLLRLESWGFAPDFAIGAVNPRGCGMRPDLDTTLVAIARSEVPVIASDLRAGGTVTLAEGVAFARTHGATGLLPELVDLDEVGSELRAIPRD